jgi:hypothetical protein
VPSHRSPIVWVLVVTAACGGAVRQDAAPVPPAVNVDSEVVVRAQTQAEAFEYLWHQLGDMRFFRENHYDVALPAHPLFDKLAKEGLEGADKEAARRVFEAEVYAPDAFAAGLRTYEGVPHELRPALDAFERWSSRWGFERAPRYEIVLTLYGPGGSYDADKATITVLTTVDGRFKKPPLDNSVHEMVHLGIERPIVRRLGLSHAEKERLVDRVCVVAFGGWLKGYKPQPMGPPELDPFVSASTLDDLPAAITRYRAR